MNRNSSTRARKAELTTNGGRSMLIFLLKAELKKSEQTFPQKFAFCSAFSSFLWSWTQHTLTFWLVSKDHGFTPVIMGFDIEHVLSRSWYVTLSPPLSGFDTQRALSLCLVSPPNVSSPFVWSPNQRAPSLRLVSPPNALSLCLVSPPNARSPLLGLATRFVPSVLFPEELHVLPLFSLETQYVLSLPLSLSLCSVSKIFARSPFLWSPQGTRALPNFGHDKLGALYCCLISHSTCSLSLPLCFVSRINARSPFFWFPQGTYALPLFSLDTQRAYSHAFTTSKALCTIIWSRHSTCILSLCFVSRITARCPFLWRPQGTRALPFFSLDTQRAFSHATISTATRAFTLFGLFTQHDLQYLH